jgi:hypothetical protein
MPFLIVESSASHLAVQRTGMQTLQRKNGLRESSMNQEGNVHI